VNERAQVRATQSGLGDRLLRGLVETGAGHGRFRALGRWFAPPSETDQGRDAFLFRRREAQGDGPLAGDEAVGVFAV
jgi:hypothetical protein